MRHADRDDYALHRLIEAQEALIPSQFGMLGLSSAQSSRKAMTEGAVRPLPRTVRCGYCGSTNPKGNKTPSLLMGRRNLSATIGDDPRYAPLEPADEVDKSRERLFLTRSS